MNKSVIVIGAGAAGLMATSTLSKAGFNVTVLEARDRIGGRIYTYSNGNFTQPVELGAEFIHGNLPLTLQLLKQFNIAFELTSGGGFEVQNGKWQPATMFNDQWEEFISHLEKLEDDDSIANILQEHFSHDKYDDLREDVTRYVEGYDAADIHLASAKAFLDEWQNEEDDQYHIKGGYLQLMQALQQQCLQRGTAINLNTVVQRIQWHENKVEVHTINGQTFTAAKAVITVPLGVLQADALSNGAITFAPSLPAKLEAVKQLGFGSVIKVLMQFSQQFWMQLQQQNMPVNKAGFIFSKQPLPTWWSQLPNTVPLLTGWLAGPKARLLEQVSDEAILQQATQSLAAIFNFNEADILQHLVASKVVNWGAEPYSKGAYTFPVINSLQARKKLIEPVENTLFFAGEACFEGHETGTVEAALQSGKNVAERIIQL